MRTILNYSKGQKECKCNLQEKSLGYNASMKKEKTTPMPLIRLN